MRAVAPRSRRRSGYEEPAALATTIVEVTTPTLRLAVVADTHSAPHPNTLPLLTREKPARILHAGDIGRLEVIDQLATVAPVIAIRGNIDEPHCYPDAIRVEFVRTSEILLRLLLLHIAVRGPHLMGQAQALAAKERANLVVCGHSHVPLIARSRGLAVFNPGSVGPRRFNLPITMGFIEFGPTGIGLRHVDCETGDAWRP